MSFLKLTVNYTPVYLYDAGSGSKSRSRYTLIDIEKAISKHKDNVVCVAVGEDAMLNNLQRCSKNKKVYLAEDVNAALSAC